MSGRIINKTVKALFWSGIERLGFQGVNLVVRIVMARLLLPKDFGLVSMLVIFISISQAIIDGGFGQALIQKKNANKSDYSTIFYFNISLALVCYLLLFLAAPYIASFYNEIRLVNLTRVVGLNLIISGLGQIHYTILIKNIDFKIISKVRIVSVVFAGVIGIVIAFYGAGVWALVFFTICSNFIRTVLLWIFNNWRPEIVFNWNSLKQLFSYGSKLFLSAIIAVVFENIYSLIIGKFFSAKDLGYYSQAKTFQLVPVFTLSLIIENVIFPTFSKIQDDISALKRGFAKALQLQVFINFPLMLGLIVVAKPLIIVLLTDKWIETALYLQLLCISGLFYPMGVTNLNILKVIGRSDLYFKLTLFGKGLTVVSILIGLQWGIIGLIVGRILKSALSSLIIMVVAGRKIDYKLVEQLKDILPVFICSVIMAFLLYFIGIIVQSSFIYLLFIQFLSGMLFYMGMSYILKVTPFIEGSLMLKKVLVRK